MGKRLAILSMLMLGCTNNALDAPADMAAGNDCPAYRACYMQPGASQVGCQAGFSALGIARATELEQCKLIECLADHGDAAPRRCDDANDPSADCQRCLRNAELGGQLGPCDPPNDPDCNLCAAFVSACYGP